MKIAIDCRWIFLKVSGVGRYTENLTSALKEIDHNNKYLLLKASLIPYGIFSLINQIKLPLFLKKSGADIYHSANFMIPLFVPKNIKVIITIHDLIPFKFPQYTPNAKKTRFNWFFKWIFKKAVNRADKIIVNSNNTARDLIECLNAPMNKIKVIYLGIDPGFFQNTPYRQDSYILFVGRPEPYKNLDLLIKAYNKLLKDYKIENKLLIAGSMDPRYPEALNLVDKLGLKNKVIFQGYIGHQELVKTYQGASVLVLPSLYEGFGLPPLEAMASGVPAIVSNTPALTETTAGRALVIGPYDINGLAGAIYKVLTDNMLAERLSREGRDYARNFTVQNMAKLTLKVYEDCANT